MDVSVMTDHFMQSWLCADVIRVTTKTLLEEPRAELTTLHTLRLLPASGLIDQAPSATWNPTWEPTRNTAYRTCMTIVHLSCQRHRVAGFASAHPGQLSRLAQANCSAGLWSFQSAGLLTLRPGAGAAYCCVTCVSRGVQAGVANIVASFMLQDLRRFQMYDSSATRPCASTPSADTLKRSSTLRRPVPSGHC